MRMRRIHLNKLLLAAMVMFVITVSAAPFTRISRMHTLHNGGEGEDHHDHDEEDYDDDEDFDGDEYEGRAIYSQLRDAHSPDLVPFYVPKHYEAVCNMIRERISQRMQNHSQTVNATTLPIIPVASNGTVPTANSTTPVVVPVAINSTTTINATQTNASSTATNTSSSSPATNTSSSSAYASAEVAMSPEFRLFLVDYDLSTKPSFAKKPCKQIAAKAFLKAEKKKCKHIYRMFGRPGLRDYLRGLVANQAELAPQARMRISCGVISRRLLDSTKGPNVQQRIIIRKGPFIFPSYE